MKDPAVLFYFQDFLVGTEFMTDAEVGKYIRILCHQADKGALSLLQLKRVCRTDEVPDAIMEKLRVDEDGNYYQNRMRVEREKRISYSDSRRKNREKKEVKDDNICESYDIHMENEDVNEDIIVNKNEYESVIEDYHTLCPKMSKVQVLSEMRKKHIHARLAEFGRDKITEAFRIAGQSSFLNGVNDRAWKADFDWIIKPEKFIKIIEGKYDKAEQVRQISR